MNKKEIAEIKRRLTLEKHNITNFRGCYVNQSREIIAEFTPSFLLLPEDEIENYLAVFKRTLSGTIGKNLIDIEFSTAQVEDSEEHSILMDMRGSALNDEAAVQTFYEKVINSLSLETNYVILLMTDTYDIPSRSKDGQKLDGSLQSFSYMMCSICPVRSTAPALSYSDSDNTFHNRRTDYVISSPELGFMFPAFDGRSSNIYGALYYTRSTDGAYNEFIDSVFRTEIPLSADAEREAFKSVLETALNEDCSFNLVQTVSETLKEMIDSHEEAKLPEPLEVTKNDVKTILKSCSISDEKLTAFEENYDTAIGAGVALNPQNIIDIKSAVVRTPDAVIKLSTDKIDLIETRVIDGVKYVLIRADEGIELNGVRVEN